MHFGFLVDLKQMDYEEAAIFQGEVHHLRALGLIPDTLLLVEHPPVFTIGRSGGSEHLKVDRETLRKKGVKVLEVDRGGSITFHGYGQLVAYPIIHMETFRGDLHHYLHLLEELLIQVLREYGIAGERFPPYTGVWVEQEKIAAIGVACRGAVMTHGFALNVKTDLHYFSLINPCGIASYSVTTMTKLLSSALAIENVKRLVQASFTDVFGVRLRQIAPEDLLVGSKGEHAKNTGMVYHDLSIVAEGESCTP